MQVEILNDLDKVTENKEFFEKVLLAYWYSVPCDNPTSPDKIEMVRDYGYFFHTNLIKNNKVYGISSITKKEIRGYLTKLKTLKAHELDVIKRIDEESK